jgi:3-deoxy-D-manno-octulosonate 8-phosphate phosphatase KdsC-like HAD superfamily phosphatase
MFAHVTTRIEGRKHDGLLSEKGFGGFPSIAAMDENGDIIAKLSGGRDVAGFEAMMASGAKFMEIRGKAEKTLDDEVFLLKHDIEMGNADLAAAKDRVAKLEGLSDEQKKEIDGLLTDLEIMDAMGNPTSREEAEALQKTAQAKFAEMHAAGRQPTGERPYSVFYSLLLQHAEAESDVALFEAALGKLRERFGDNPRAARFFEMNEKKLEEMKAAQDSDGGDADGEGEGSDGDG